jgi:flagellar motor switch protein FliN/FliY
MSTAEHWIKQLPLHLFQQERRPLLGFPPPFPWKELGDALAKQLQLSALTLEPHFPPEWREESDALGELGDRPLVLAFTATPMRGSFWLAMARADIEWLMQSLLDAHSDSPVIIDEAFLEGFYAFLAVEAIHLLPSLPFDREISVNIQSETPLPKAPLLCLHVAIGLSERTLIARLLLSPELLQAWNERYADRSLNTAIAQNLSLLIDLQIGRTQLTFSEWKQVCVGDFLLLDACSIRPEDGQSTVVLGVEGIPLFRGVLNEGALTLLEGPVYDEVEVTMSKEPPDEEKGFEEEEWSDAGVENTDLDDTQEGETEETSLNEETDPQAFNEETWPPLPERTEQKERKESSTVAAEKVIEEQVSRPLTPEEIPLNLIVEMGRLQMSVQNLLELQSGNVLDLNIRPEDGVNLVVNGRRIAKGELLRIGDTLGVRILDLG